MPGPANYLQMQLQQAQLLKQQQLMQQRDNNAGFFDQMGVPPPQQPGQPPQGGALVPGQYIPQIAAQNLGGGVQGAATNTGLLLGQAINRAFGNKNPQDLPQADQESQIKLQGQQQIAELISKKVPPDQAMQQVAQKMISEGADTHNPTKIRMGKVLWDEYLTAAEQVKKIKSFTPYNVSSPDGNAQAMVTSEDEESVYKKMGWVKAGEKSLSTPYAVERGARPDNDMMENAFHPEKQADGSWKLVRVPELDRSKITNTRTVEPGSQTRWENALSTGGTAADMMTDLQKNTTSGRWGRGLLNVIGNVSGTMKSAMGLVGDNSTLNPDNYTDFTSKNSSAIEKAGMSQAEFVRVAYAIASANKAASGEGLRASVAETKLIMNSLGENLGDVNTVKKVLQQAKEQIYSGLENKRQTDKEYVNDPWLLDRMKWLKGKTAAPQEEVPGSLTQQDRDDIEARILARKSKK